MHEHLQFVAITFDDGSLGVMQLLRALRGERAIDVTDEYIDGEIARSVFDRSPVSWRRIAFEDVPTTRAFRDAWRDRGGSIVHDMPKARDICRDRLRALRQPRLDALDIEYQRADESGNAAEKKRIAALKQRLRDAPADPRIDAAQTIDDFGPVLADAHSAIQQR